MGRYNWKVPKESKRNRSARATETMNRLEDLYPGAATELGYATPFELLIATMLSAQATDVSVNAASPGLFARYPTAEDLARADPAAVSVLIRSIGLHKTKAKNVVRAAQLLVERHGGEVPPDLAALTELPGVGTKTANVVLANAFGRPAIAVDTHVGRLARRLGFSTEQHPDAVQANLEELFPKASWIFLHHALILHGRRVCHARTPNCQACALADLCPESRV